MDNIKIQLSDEQNLTAIIMPRLYARVFSPKDKHPTIAYPGYFFKGK